MAEQTILIAEDDPDIRDGVRILLSGEGYHIIEAENGTRALEVFRPEVDLVILDIMMPGMSGLRVCEELRKLSTVPILFLTAKSQESDKLLGLTAGGDDYLPKPFEPLELVLRIKNILKRAPQVREEVRDKLDLGLCVYDLNKKELHTKQGQIIHITPVEQALLGVLGQKSGQIFTREKLAELLGAGQSPRSIDVQITRLRKKIEKDSKNPRYLQTVRGKGYMLLPE